MVGRPNVVVVLVDDQGYGDLGCHGHPVLKTPELDSFHAESVRLRDFHVHPMCTPTRGSLLTGLDALRHGAVNVSSGRALLRRDVQTLPEVMNAAGYRTALFGKWHLGDTFPYRPQDRGFEHVEWFPSSHIGSAPDRWETDYFDPWLRANDGEGQASGYCTDVFFDDAIAWMSERVAAGEPFFSLVSLNAAHIPLLVAEKYREPYRQHGHELATYFGMIANIDENMGKLDAALADMGISDDTLVVYMSDNGAARSMTEFYNAGMRGKKTELWEGGHRVPFFARWPAGGIGGPGRGRDVDALTIAQDFMPSVLSLCGIDTSGMSFDGHDISDLLIDEPTASARTSSVADRVAVIQYSRMNAAEPTYGDAAVLRGKWRLIGDTQLYQVDNDPGQEKDVAGEYPEIVAELRDHYRQWWSGVSGRAGEYLDVVVGADEEPTCLLSPAEWRDVFLDQQRQIRAGIERNGVWGIEVVQGGRYRISLRRWPRESGLAMQAPAPEYDGGDCTYSAGVALPVVEAVLRIGDAYRRRAVADGDEAAVFDVDLSAGTTTLQTWFLDENGRELCGAYYAYVDLLDVRQS